MDYKVQKKLLHLIEKKSSEDRRPRVSKQHPGMWCAYSRIACTYIRWDASELGRQMAIDTSNPCN